jgi:hypothetical protein
MPVNSKLRERPRLLRTKIAKGLSAGEESPVDRTGGDRGAGLIRGFAVVTRGEALGHDMWIDGVFLQQVADSINASGAGVKSRYTHPDLSGDGLGKHLGRTKNALVDGDVVRADEHFAKSAHHTPDGDLAGYLMDRAEEDPASFGASISFAPDYAAEDQFISDHGGSAFQSPDPLNVNNYPHVRLKRLRAVDMVGDPAANPEGLFSVDGVIEEAETLADYVFGFSDERPQAGDLGIDPDRARGFIARFLDRHGLAIVPKQEKEHSTMSEQTKPTESKPDELQEAGKLAVESSAEANARPAERAKEGHQFLAAFGDRGGRWFAEGKSFAEAQSLYLGELRAENERLTREKDELKKQLAANRGEAAPVAYEADKLSDATVARLRNAVGSDSLARFAAGIQLRD